MSATTIPDFDVELETGLTALEWKELFVDYGHKLYLSAREDHKDAVQEGKEEYADKEDAAWECYTARCDMKKFRPLYLLAIKRRIPQDEKAVREAFSDFYSIQTTRLAGPRKVKKTRFEKEVWEIVKPLVMRKRNRAQKPRPLTVAEAIKILADGSVKSKRLTLRT